MQNNTPVYPIFLFMAALIIFAIWWEVGLWKECRETNSFFYCVRTIVR